MYDALRVSLEYVDKVPYVNHVWFVFRGSSRSSYRPSIPSVSDAGDTNFKWKDVKQIKLIGMISCKAY